MNSQHPLRRHFRKKDKDFPFFLWSAIVQNKSKMCCCCCCVVAFLFSFFVIPMHFVHPPSIHGEGVLQGYILIYSRPSLERGPDSV